MSGSVTGTRGWFTMKVLVTGAGALLGQGIIKSLRMAPTQYEIVAVDPDPRAVGLYWADKAYLVPFAVDPGYVDRIWRIIDRERPEALLVGTDVELMMFAIHKSQIELCYDTRVIVSSQDVIRIADDKWLTYEFLASNGFPHPKSSLPDGVSDLLCECAFPLIVKPRVGARSVGVHKVRNEQELNLALSQVQNPIIQECVATPEQEYTSGIVISAGIVRATVTMRRNLRDGNTYRAYVEPDAPFNGLLANVAEKLGGLGPLNFQFRLDQGVPKIFEINARFSGTTPLRAYTGFNEVDAVVRHFVLGEEIPEYQLHRLVVLRYWNEILVEDEQIATLKNQGSLNNPHYEQKWPP